jgi:hypothetical protein
MAKELKKTEDLPNESEVNPTPAVEQTPSESQESADVNLSEQLDKEEAEFRAIRRDLDGVKGVSGAGVVAISVGKVPTKNEFFRTHKLFKPIVPIVDVESGMERQYFAVTHDMIEPLASIGITATDHVLYFTVTARGAFRIVPVRQAVGDAEQMNTTARKSWDSYRAWKSGCASIPTRKTIVTAFTQLR